MYRRGTAAMRVRMVRRSLWHSFTPDSTFTHPNALGAAELAAVLWEDLMASGLTAGQLARTGVA